MEGLRVDCKMGFQSNHAVWSDVKDFYCLKIPCCDVDCTFQSNMKCCEYTNSQSTQTILIFTLLFVDYKQLYIQEEIYLTHLSRVSGIPKDISTCH